MTRIRRQFGLKDRLDHSRRYPGRLRPRRPHTEGRRNLLPDPHL